MKAYIILVVFLFYNLLALAQTDARIFTNYKEESIVNYDTIKFSENVNILFAGPVNYNGHNSYFSEAPISIDSSQINTAYFTQSYFKFLDISKSIFSSMFVFNHVSGEDLYLDNNIFKNGYYAQYCNPFKKIILRFNKFNNPTKKDLGLTFDSVNITDGITIQNNTFTTVNNSLFKDCDLSNFNSSYNKYNQFQITYSKAKDVIFHSDTFNDIVSFDSLFLIENIVFDYCTFSTRLNLNRLIMPTGKTITFTDTYLPDTIDISNNLQFDGMIDLTTANYNFSKRKVVIILNDFPVKRIKFDYKHFQLIFPKLNNRNISDDDKSNIYKALLDNLKELGYLNSYELLDIEYQRHKAKTSFLGFLWFVPEYWNNYGYKKVWVFYWTMIFLVLFTLITFRHFDVLTRQVYNIDNIPEQPLWMHVKNNKLKWTFIRNRIWYSFVYTATIFFLLLLKVDKLHFNRKLGLMYVMLIYSMGIICLAYMASYVLQK